MCTNFKILAKKDNKITGVSVGRSQEFGIQMSTALFFRKAGHQYTQSIAPLLKCSFPEDVVEEIEENYKYQWVGKYGFVAFNSENFINTATDGMNTKGLCIGSLLLNETESCSFTLL